MSRHRSAFVTTQVPGPGARLLARLCRVGTAGRDAGMTTAEYAVGTIAACGFAGVLYKAITSSEVLAAVKHVVVRAFQQAF